MHDHEQKTEHKSFTKPEEVRPFPHGRAEILTVGGAEVGRMVFEPGWRWSNDVKPLANTASCEAPHFQYHVAGKLAIRMDDGTEIVAGPGDITSLPKGHDAWVVGDDPVVVIDWFGASNYAKRSWRSPSGAGGAGKAGLLMVPRNGLRPALGADEHTVAQQRARVLVEEGMSVARYVESSAPGQRVILHRLHVL